MIEWKLESSDSFGINIMLSFDDPLLVSKGEIPDQLMLQLKLGDLTAENSGASMPNSVIKYISIPTQMANLEEAKAIESSG